MPRRRKPTGVCTICGVSGHVSRFCRLQTPARSGRKPSAEIAKGPNVGFNSGQGGQHPPVRPSQQQADIQPEKQSTMPRQRRTLPLNADDDNTGEALWRSGKTPTTVFRLPDSFDPLAFGDANTKFNRLHQVAIDTRTYIVRKKGSDIEIYGSPNDAAEAKSRILAWVEEYDLPKRSKRRSDSWTKINNITPDQRDQIDKRIMREEKRNQWRKPPDIKNGKYMHRFEVPWPDSKWDLQDYLGQHLEALDPIRMDCKCHIIFIIKPEPYFVLIGNHADKMKDAVRRIQNIDRQVFARQLEPYTYFLIKPFAHKDLRNEILLRRYLGSKSFGSMDGHKEAGVTMHQHGHSLRDGEGSAYNMFAWALDELNPGSILFGNPCAERINGLYVNLWTSNPLEYLRYFNGFLQMRASIGSCVFTSYRKPENNTYRLDFFKEMLQDRNIQQETRLTSCFSQELGNKGLEQKILAKFLAATDRLVFCGKSVFGIFNLPHPDGKPYDYRLEVELKVNDNDSDIVSQKWYRLEAGEDSLIKVVDINLLDLHHSELSHNLAISRCHSLLNSDQQEKLPAPYRSFSGGITLDCDRARDPKCSRKFIKYPAQDNLGHHPTVNINSLQQKRSWHFTVKNTLYNVELSTIQTIKFQYSPTFDVVANEQRWSVQIWHPQWDIHLSENARLLIGECASWEAKEWFFFPAKGMNDMSDMEELAYERGSGCAELLRVLGVVEGVIMDENLDSKT